MVTVHVHAYYLKGSFCQIHHKIVILYIYTYVMRKHQAFWIELFNYALSQYILSR